MRTDRRFGARFALASAMRRLLRSAACTSARVKGASARSTLTEDGSPTVDGVNIVRP
jgi:hypothetical protein